jgi:flagellar hook-associated protein 3 FlgL
MYRITTANAFNASISSLQQRQQSLSQAQERLTSGKRVEKASDDPVAAAAAERAQATISHADANQRALDASTNSMTLAESALGDANDLLQQIREAVVQAGNASYSDAQRGDLANQIAALRGQLLTVANRTDGAGNYLFGGQGASQPPFLDAAGGVQYRGSPGATLTASDEALPLTVDGQPAWLQASSGNGVFQTAAAAGNTGSAWIDAGNVTNPSQITGSTYTVQFSVSGGATTYSVLQDGNPTALSGVPFQSGKAIEIDGQSFTVSGSPADGDSFTSTPATPTQNIFDTLDRTIAELKTPQRNSGQITQTVQSGLRDIDQSMSALQSLRSQVGEVLNQADAAGARNSANKEYAQTAQSNATDLDMVQAISDFQNQQSGYDAALKTYSMVQNLSLFQYISA